MGGVMCFGFSCLKSFRVRSFCCANSPPPNSNRIIIQDTNTLAFYKNEAISLTLVLGAVLTFNV